MALKIYTRVNSHVKGRIHSRKIPMGSLPPKNFHLERTLRDSHCYPHNSCLLLSRVSLGEGKPPPTCLFFEPNGLERRKRKKSEGIFHLGMDSDPMKNLPSPTATTHLTHFYTSSTPPPLTLILKFCIKNEPPLPIIFSSYELAQNVKV